ncbi:MAG: hypothetical protein Kow0074_13490 [Candidatus Zixiibacteriota bacterium]
MIRILPSVIRFALLTAVGLMLLSSAGIASDDPSPDDIGPIQLLQSEQEALMEIFGDIDSTRCDTIVVSDTMRTHLEKRLARSIHDSVYIVYTVYDDGEQRGLAIVTEEQGKYRPITFMAGVDRMLRIIDVRVLVYRENRGGEVQRSRFLGQYRGKDLGDPIRINRDIINITGATISVRSLNAGVRKVLAVAEWLRGGSEMAE